MNGPAAMRLSYKISERLAERAGAHCTDNRGERLLIARYVIDAIEKAGYEIVPTAELNDEIQHSKIEIS